MLDERQQRFVQKARVAVLATARRDGSPHLSPVWFRYEDGVFAVLIERGSQKHRNIERDPRVELCVDDKTPPYHTVIVRGRATVHPAPERAWRLALAVHYLGEEGGRRYIETRETPNNIMLRITPEKIVGW